MSSKLFTITVLALVALIVYLFVSAPPLLAEKSTVGETIPIEQVLSVIAAENDIVRALYTKEIVGAGLNAGLAFDERWQDQNVEAGPLPALFLRAMAASLEKNPVRLGLFLGSDFPINASNHFDGRQTEAFQLIKETQEPPLFYAADTQLHTAMFADLAVVQACVTCHNQHPDSPKQDWKMGDVMGATTWTYPKALISRDEMAELLLALRKASRDSYAAYLEKTQTFSKPPQIGAKWPRDGYYLPTADLFMEEVARRSSPHTLDAILSGGNVQ